MNKYLIDFLIIGLIAFIMLMGWAAFAQRTDEGFYFGKQTTDQRREAIAKDVAIVRRLAYDAMAYRDLKEIYERNLFCEDELKLMGIYIKAHEKAR